MAAPIQAAQMTSYPFGVRSFGMPIIGDDTPTTGRVFFVDSTSGNKGDDSAHGSDPFAPFATLAYAITQTTADRGDRIYVLAGHVETVLSAAAINVNKAGIQIFGLGSGRNRPTFNFTTSVAATIAINGASVWMRNLVFNLTGIDALVTGIDVKASDFTIEGCDFTVANASGQAWHAITTDSNSHRARIIGNLFAGSVDTGAISIIALSASAGLAVDAIEIGWNRIVGDFTAGIHISATSASWFSTLFIHDNQITTLGAVQTGILYNGDVAVGSTGVIANNQIVGTTKLTLIVVATTVAPYPACINNMGYDSDTPNVTGDPIPIVGTSLNAARSIYDEIIGAEFSYNRAHYIAVSVDMSSGTWNSINTHEILTITGAVRVRIIPEISTALTSGGAATLSLGEETAGTSILAATTLVQLQNVAPPPSFWYQAGNAAAAFAVTSLIDRVVAGGKDIGIAVAGATFTGGIIIFHCWWEPINSTGTVVAGAGGSL